MLRKLLLKTYSHWLHFSSNVKVKAEKHKGRQLQHLCFSIKVLVSLVWTKFNTVWTNLNIKFAASEIWEAPQKNDPCSNEHCPNGGGSIHSVRLTEKIIIFQAFGSLFGLYLAAEAEMKVLTMSISSPVWCVFLPLKPSTFSVFQCFSDRPWQGKWQYESLQRQYDQNKFPQYI